MKKLSLIICLASLPFLASAQPRTLPPERMSDEEIIRMQTSDIVSWLELDKSCEEKFVEEYTLFRKEIDAIARNAMQPRNSQSESEIEKAILHNFDVSEQILKLRKKYYSRFRKFLKPSQIQMMYHFENEAGRRMLEGHPGPGGPDGPDGPGGYEGPEGRHRPRLHGGDGPGF